MSVARDGPFFVVDALGQPLMPIDSVQAYNRLRRPEQQFEEHHVFTIFKLNHRIEKPQLRAVVLAVVPHPKAADLYIVVETSRRAHSLVRVVVDASLVDASSNDVPDAHAYVALIADVIAVLQRFLPLSHAMLPIGPLRERIRGLQNTLTPWEQQVLISLVQLFVRRNFDLYWRPLRGQSRRLRSRVLAQAIEQFVDNPATAPCVIARHGMWQYNPLGNRQPLLLHTTAHREELFYSVTLDDDHTLPGIYDSMHTDGGSRFLLPRIGYPLHVDWQHVSSERIQRIPPSVDDLVRFFRPLPSALLEILGSGSG